MSERFDVAVIGAGAAGMMAAATAGQRGRKVVLIDHASKLAEKIRISGGGRCNFTNLNTGPANFISENPHFCRSALARYAPQDFLRLVRTHRIGYHEKHKGQLFCDDSSEQMIALLRNECASAQVAWRMPCAVHAVGRVALAGQDYYRLETSSGEIVAESLIIATGGLSIPKIGATDFGYRIARQFGLRIIEPRPALVPLTFAQNVWHPFVALAGVALEVEIGVAGSDASFREDLLFTHRGLSGPAVLQISSYWNPREMLTINLAPQSDLAESLITAKSESRQNLANVLTQWLPKSLGNGWLASALVDGVPLETLANRRVAEVSDLSLRGLAQTLHAWQLLPSGTEGFRKAEVTRGGVDTRQLSQQTMAARQQPSLYFVGEVVDVTGWLGGYNFQWAWASGVAAGQAT